MLRGLVAVFHLVAGCVDLAYLSHCEVEDLIRNRRTIAVRQVLRYHRSVRDRFYLIEVGVNHRDNLGIVYCLDLNLQIANRFFRFLRIFSGDLLDLQLAACAILHLDRDGANIVRVADTGFIALGLSDFERVCAGLRELDALVVIIVVREEVYYFTLCLTGFHCQYSSRGIRHDHAEQVAFVILVRAVCPGNVEREVLFINCRLTGQQLLCLRDVCRRIYFIRVGIDHRDNLGIVYCLDLNLQIANRFFRFLRIFSGDLLDLQLAACAILHLDRDGANIVRVADTGFIALGLSDFERVCAGLRELDALVVIIVVREEVYYFTLCLTGFHCQYSSRGIRHDHAEQVAFVILVRAVCPGNVEREVLFINCRLTGQQLLCLRDVCYRVGSVFIGKLRIISGFRFISFRIDLSVNTCRYQLTIIHHNRDDKGPLVVSITIMRICCPCSCASLRIIIRAAFRSFLDDEAIDAGYQ